MEATQVSRTADHWIEETARPYYLSVTELVETGAHRKFNINPNDVEECVAQLLNVLIKFEADTVLAAVSITFILMVWRWRLKLASVLQFAENYLISGDKKPMSNAMRTTFELDFERTVSRYETVKLRKSINATKELMGEKAYEALHNGEMTTKFF